MTTDVLNRLQLEETRRANQEKERLEAEKRENEAQANRIKERENIAKYGVTDYIETSQPLANNPRTGFKAALDVFNTLLSPITSVVGAFKKGGH